MRVGAGSPGIAQRGCSGRGIHRCIARQTSLVLSDRYEATISDGRTAALVSLPSFSPHPSIHPKSPSPLLLIIHLLKVFSNEVDEGSDLG